MVNTHKSVSALKGLKDPIVSLVSEKRNSVYYVFTGLLVEQYTITCLKNIEYLCKIHCVVFIFESFEMACNDHSYFDLSVFQRQLDPNTRTVVIQIHAILL